MLLARAILKDAPIVVLDEATAFADPENEALIQRSFARLIEGRTVITIAHRLSTVVGTNKIVVLDHGRVIEQGTHDDLVESDGLYARMWADHNDAVTWRGRSWSTCSLRDRSPSSSKSPAFITMRQQSL